jgi:molybdopterin molybdotransferase
MTSGGVSVGDADYIKPVLEEIGTLSVWKVAIKPGKPLAIGNIDQCQFFGLPGNPVSTIITLNKIVKPALQKLSGQAVSVAPVFKATCLDNLRKAAGRRDYQRGIATVDASGQWQVRSTGPQGSGRLISVAEGNCYIVLEADNDGVEAGDVVNIELFDRSLE